MGHLLISAGGDVWMCARGCGWSMTAGEHDSIAQEIAEAHAAWHGSGGSRVVSLFVTEFLLGHSSFTAQLRGGV